MKTKYILLAALFFAVLAPVVAFVGDFDTVSAQSHHDTRRHAAPPAAGIQSLVSLEEYANRVAPARVVVPMLPPTLDFAGENVPLGNFDTRESLLREMLITCNMHSRTTLTLLQSERYMAIIKPILRELGVPEDFVYLCMAESGLDPNAMSVAKAAGLWQLMPATGTAAGLEVNAEVDERYDVERATRVAARHLLDSYQRFGSWTLAAAAYNLGDAGVSRRLELQAPYTSYYDVWLPDETRRYIFRILSFKLLCNNALAYGFDVRTSDYYPNLTDYHTITTADKNIKWPELAAANGTTYKLMRELNPWIRDYEYANVRGRTLTIKIPNKDLRTIH